MLSKSKIVTLVLGVLFVVSVLVIVFASRLQKRDLTKENIQQVFSSSYPASFWTKGQIPWFLNFQLDCNYSACQTFNYEGSEEGKVGFEIWRLFAETALSRMEDVISQDKIQSEKTQETIKDQVDVLYTSLKNNALGGEGRYVLGLHLANLANINSIYPNLDKIAPLFLAGGDTLLFRVEHEFQKRYANEVPMILGMIARSLVKFSSYLTTNKLSIDDLQLLNFYNLKYTTSEGKVDLASRSLMAAQRVLTVAKENLYPLEDKSVLANNSGLCWVGLAEFEIANHKNEGIRDLSSEVGILASLLKLIDRSDDFLFSGAQLNEVAACLELLYQGCLYSQGKDEICSKFRDNLLRTVEYFWDDPQNPICNGDGLFVSSSRNSGHFGEACSRNFKSLDGNSQMVNLISNFQQN